jgi:hypothetical protein
MQLIDATSSFHKIQLTSVIPAQDDFAFAASLLAEKLDRSSLRWDGIQTIAENILAGLPAGLAPEQRKRWISQAITAHIAQGNSGKGQEGLFL